LLAERAAKQRVRARVALRVNPDVFAETHPYISTGLREHKFGIDIRRARAVYRAAAKSRHLDLCGVSVHIGSQIRSAEPFGAAISRVVALVLQLRREMFAMSMAEADWASITMLPPVRGKMVRRRKRLLRRMPPH
jgi:diaminopimelate decarboxylase